MLVAVLITHQESGKGNWTLGRVFGPHCGVSITCFFSPEGAAGRADIYIPQLSAHDQR